MCSSACTPFEPSSSACTPFEPSPSALSTHVSYFIGQFHIIGVFLHAVKCCDCCPQLIKLCFNDEGRRGEQPLHQRGLRRRRGRFSFRTRMFIKLCPPNHLWGNTSVCGWDPTRRVTTTQHASLTLKKCMGQHFCLLANITHVCGNTIGMWLLRSF